MIEHVNHNWILTKLTGKYEQFKEEFRKFDWKDVCVLSTACYRYTTLLTLGNRYISRFHFLIHIVPCTAMTLSIMQSFLLGFFYL